MKRVTLFILTLLLMEATIVGQTFLSAFATTVKIDPASQQIPLPGTGTVNVSIEDVANLGAFEFKLKYDGSIVRILQPTDVHLGSFLGSTGRTVVPTGPVIDNDAGEMTFGAFTFGTKPGPNGDGVLATIIFTAQGKGASVLDLTNVQVTDINGNVIPIDVIDGRIQVGAPSATIVKIDPESQQISLPGTAEVNVKVENVTNLGAFEFTLHYDGSIVKILQPTDVHLGDFLGSTGRTVVPTGPVIDNDAGEMTFGAFTFGTKPGPNGNGVLATIIFTAQSEGSSVLDLTNVQVTDINGDVIPIDVIDGQIQVGVLSATIVKIDPESQQIPLLGAAEINVKIENVVNLGAFEFKLKYNSSIVKIMQPTDVKLGGFLGSTGRTVVPTGPVIDNDTGEMTFGAFTFGANPGPDGNGVLATIKFTAQSEGSSVLDLTNVQVTDINGDVIPIDVIDGQIQVGAPPMTIVKIDPESQQISLPGTAEINVKIENVVNLGAFEFKLKYNSSIVKIMQPTDVKLGGFLGSTGRTVVQTGPVIDNDAGEMSFGAFTFGANPGPDGDGVLATIKFTAQSEGISVLDLTNVQVTDINGDVIPIDVFDGEVQVRRECNPGDVSGNGTISAYDASLILQYTVGLITEFPVDKVGAPNYDIAPRNYIIWAPEQSAKSGEVIDVPIAIGDATGLLAGGISVKYDPTILKAVDVTAFPLLSGSYWQANVQLKGEVRVAFAGTAPLQGKGNLLKIKFEVLPQADGKTSPIIFSQVNLSNSLAITKRNGAVTVFAPKFALLQNFPNPFNPETWLPYQLAMDADVVIHIHNMRGQLIRSIFVGWQTVGSYVTKDRAVYWDGRDNLGEMVSSGVYFYTLQAGNFKATRRMLIVK